MTKGIEETYLKIDNETKLLDSSECGSTCCICILKKEGTDQRLYVSNCGDARAILISYEGNITRMSKDHKASDPDEQERI